MTNVSLDGKSTETVNKEFIDKLGDSGIFEGTYICLPANIKEDVREKLANKYLDWQPIWCFIIIVKLILHLICITVNTYTHLY